MALVNGDFETGDLTGWATHTTGDHSTPPVVNTSSKHSGTYGCQLQCSTSQRTCLIYQSIGTAEPTDTLTIWVFTAAKPGLLSDAAVSIDGGVSSHSLNSNLSTWTKNTHTLASLGLTETAADLEVTIGCSDQDSEGMTVYVDDITLTQEPIAPVASFTTDVSSGELPLTVKFTDTSTNTPTSWSWEFDDGTDPSTEQNPEHEFEEDGTYHVVLTATNGAGSDASDPVTITVALLAPVASFTYAVEGDQVRFTDTSGEQPTSWDWDFGDGSPHSTLQNPTHRYPKSGGG